MRKVLITAAAALLAAAPAFTADAQMSKDAANIAAQAQNFTPVERAACGPFRGRWCGPFHHRVCRLGRCWCAYC